MLIAGLLQELTVLFVEEYSIGLLGLSFLLTKGFGGMLN
jgi:hypothetical protein